MQRPRNLTSIHYNLASLHSHPSTISLPLDHQHGAKTRKTQQSGQDRLLHGRGAVGDGGKGGRAGISSDGGQERGAALAAESVPKSGLAAEERGLAQAIAVRGRGFPSDIRLHNGSTARCAQLAGRRRGEHVLEQHARGRHRGGVKGGVATTLPGSGSGGAEGCGAVAVRCSILGADGRTEGEHCVKVVVKPLHIAVGRGTSQFISAGRVKVGEDDTNGGVGARVVSAQSVESGGKAGGGRVRTGVSLCCCEQRARAASEAGIRVQRCKE